MKKFLKIFVAVIAFGGFFLPTEKAYSFQDGGGEVTCPTGTTGLCWILTVNGNKTAKCKETTGSTKDCAYSAV